MGIGVVCQKGKKEDRFNQDDFVVIGSGENRVVGVFDGHGPHGAQLAGFVQKGIAENLIKVLSSKCSEPVESSLVRIHHEVHAACKLHAAVVDDKEKFDCVSSGTTSSVAIIGPEKITIGVVGDSRSIVATEKKNRSRVFKLTHSMLDQTCERKDERMRIEESGGEVRRLKGDIPHRVFVKDHGYPGLAMTRSIGDTSGQKAGIIPTPEIITLEKNHKKEQFLVIASDGVWEFLSSESVVEIVSGFSKDSAQAAAEAVVKKALIEWEKQSPWAIDDITCIIAWL